MIGDLWAESSSVMDWIRWVWRVLQSVVSGFCYNSFGITVAI